MMQRADSVEKTLILGRIDGKGEGVADDDLVSITDSMDMNLSRLWEIVKGMEAWHAAVHEVAKSQTRLSDWLTTNGTGGEYREG